MPDGLRIRSSCRVVLLVALSSVGIQASSCPDPDLAQQVVRSAIVSILDEPDKPPPPNWRVHWMVLKKGTEISSFDFLNNGTVESYACGGWCVLFFLDLNPSAHFSHPTRILVYDADPVGASPIFEFEDTKWWPTIRQDTWDHPVSVFNTVASRNDPSHIFIVGGPSGELPTPEDPSRPRARLVARSTGLINPATTTPGPIPTPTIMPFGVDVVGPCNSGSLPVWAILVNGFDDADDTFDEDVVGMYSVLKGLGVDESRVHVLSSVPLTDEVTGWRPASKIAVKKAFEQTLDQMKDCTAVYDGETPGFLLFWSSHGSGGGLFCNHLDGPGQDPIWSSDLDGWILDLETSWKDGEGPDLATTVVIEACESGLIGETLKGTNSDHRWIFTSAKGVGSVSCGDVDENIAGKDDPNPADIGSETIWGYIEAYGTASAHDDADGKISFKEAVQYAKNSDVGFVEDGSPIEHSCRHESMSWMPAAPDPMFVHGAWNTSVRAPVSVAFTEPTSTTAVAWGGPPTADVLPGESVKLEVEISNAGEFSEVGALALRLFRNDRTVTTEKWLPWYYEEDNLRTTVMMSGLPVNQPVPLEYTLAVPESMQEGEEMRFVVELDSAQPTPVATGTGTVVESRTSEIVLKVGKKCKSLCCWWRDLWD